VVAAILAVASISLGAPEWAAVSAGVEATGVANVGVAITGVVAKQTGLVATTGVAATTGTATTGTATTGMAATGMAIGTIIMAVMSSLSVTSAFHGGGVGAGVPHGVGAIRTGTVMATRMAATAMDTTADTVTDTTAAPADTDTATRATVIMDTASAAGPECPSYSAGSLALVITTGPSTAFWDHRRVEQFGLTSAIAGMQADEVPFA